MGHGSHWAAVLNDFDKDLSAGLTLATEAGQLLGQRGLERLDGPFGVDEARIALLQGTRQHGGGRPDDETPFDLEFAFLPRSPEAERVAAA